MTKTLAQALRYRERGFSMIPIRCGEKTPHVAWEQYQSKKPSPELIRVWFNRWPDAGIGVVTGDISGVDVVDVDSIDAEDRLIEAVPEILDLDIPIAKTPRGKHFYFRATKNSNATGVLDGVDFRGQGGYAIAPPSRGENGKRYSWVKGASIFEIDPPEMPSALSSLLNNYKASKAEGGAHRRLQDTDHTRPQVTTSDHIRFDQGHRDETLFHIANYLVKGGMPDQEIEQLLRVMASQLCKPPFPEKEIPAKIKSALKRNERSERNLAQEIREWILTTNGHIMTTDVHRELQLTTRREKKTASMTMLRLVEEGVLERAGNRAGCFRRIERDYEIVDLNTLEDLDPINLALPLGIERFVELMPKDLIVFAGSPNTGKTALMLETVRLNMDKYQCFYFSSELGRYAAKKRLAKHETCHKWTFKFIDDFSDYLDVIQPDNVNFIDYVEVIDGEYYKIPSILGSIQRRLRDGIAIVALQKNPGLSHGLGGPQTKAKPALFCTIEEERPGARITLEKVKNYRAQNPNGYSRRFKIVDGINLYPQGDWEQRQLP